MKLITGLTHKAYHVTDMQASLRFYCECLGLQKIFELQDEKGEDWLVYLKIADREFIELFYGGSIKRDLNWPEHLEDVEHYSEDQKKRFAHEVATHICFSVLYHNHDMELRLLPESDRTPLDHFLDVTGNTVPLQLDIGWAGIAGDEIEIARKYADRIMIIHCKDFYEGARAYSAFDMPSHLFAPIGEGIIKTKEVLHTASNFPRFNGTIIIDQDQSPTNLLKDIEVGFHNLEMIGRSAPCALREETELLQNASTNCTRLNPF